MRKLILVSLLFTFYFSLFTSPKVFAGWPINRTPEITGVVTDATTGQPIENAVVSAEWLKATPSPGGDVRQGIASEVAVTDKDGKYVIPAKTTIHTFSCFDGVYLNNISHPLYIYELKNNMVCGPGWIIEDIKRLKEGFVGCYYEGRKVMILNNRRKLYGIWKDGRIQCDVKMVNIEEKYLKSSKPLYFGWYYFVWAEIAGAKYDLKDVLNKYEELAYKYNKKPKGWAIPWIEEQVNRQLKSDRWYVNFKDAPLSNRKRAKNYIPYYEKLLEKIKKIQGEQ